MYKDDNGNIFQVGKISTNTFFCEKEWRRNYNENPPHSALGNITPDEYANRSLEAGSILCPRPTKKTYNNVKLTQEMDQRWGQVHFISSLTLKLAPLLEVRSELWHSKPRQDRRHGLFIWCQDNRDVVALLA